MKNDIRDSLINIILKVAMQHHDDISKQDEDAVCDAADEILEKYKVLVNDGVIRKCIYCNQTSQQSGRSMFLIHAAGAYYQCYPELCKENKNKINPDGSAEL